jgi:hypothetical protein
VDALEQRRAHGPVRTYKTRKGRMAPAQHEALERLLPTHGVPVHGQLLDPAAVFGRRPPCAGDRQAARVR